MTRAAGHAGPRHEAPVLVRIENVRKVFGQRSKRTGVATETIALDGVGFDVKEGELVSVLGPSGCGKTTLLRIIGGLIQADGGRVTLQGVTVSGPRNDCCMVFQSFGLFPWRTALRNVEYPLELDGAPLAKRRAIARKYIRLVGLQGFENHYPHELSGGMQQRVGLTRALVREPILLLMDEPFAALDAQTREQLQQEFLRIWSVTRQTVILVTHSIDEAIMLSDRIVVLSSRPGTVKEIIEVPFHEHRGTFDLRAGSAFWELRQRVRRLLEE